MSKLSVDDDKMTPEEVAKWLEHDTWYFAKTMAKWPHWYLVRSKMNSWKRDRWNAVIQYTRDHGTLEDFKGEIKPHLYLDGYKYWTGMKPPSDIEIINRERIK